MEAATSVESGPVSWISFRNTAVWLPSGSSGEPVTPEDVRRHDVLERLVRSIKAYHGCSEIPGSFSPFRIVEEYRESAGDRG